MSNSMIVDTVGAFEWANEDPKPAAGSFVRGRPGETWPSKPVARGEFFFVHEQSGHVGKKREYSVTHSATGLAVKFYPSRSEAERVMRALDTAQMSADLDKVAAGGSREHTLETGLMLQSIFDAEANRKTAKASS